MNLKPLIISAIAGSLITIIIFFIGLYGAWTIDVHSLENASYLASVVSAFITVVTVILLYKTYKSQNNELRETRAAIKLQKIDSAFFNMTSQLQEIVKGFSVTKEVLNDESGELITTSRKIKLEGRNYLREALLELHECFNKNLIEANLKMNIESGYLKQFHPPISLLTMRAMDVGKEIEETFGDNLSLKDCCDRILKAYQRFIEFHGQNLGHYFRFVYSIIGYINRSSISEGEKNRYFELLQAQLSNDEMGLILYEALQTSHQSGDQTFKNWLEESGLLENISQQSLYAHWHHWLYPLTMFKFLKKHEVEEKTAYQKSFL